MEFAACLAVGFIAYVYLVFPALIYLRGLVISRPWKVGDQCPRVSVVVVCFNEAGGIQSKLDNLFECDYPHDQIEVIVASDGSTDETEQIVDGYPDARVRLLAFPRRGKIPALNDAVESANGELIVFTDANSVLSSNALKNLTRHFADPTIGCVAGNQVYVKDTHGGTMAEGEQSYWNFDRSLKVFQSRSGNAISATGALYAIRAVLFKKVPSGVTDDFTISTNVIREGFRLVYDNDAIAKERVAGKSKTEFNRKIRIITRGLRAVLLARDLCNPFRYGFYSIQLFSHKVMRRIAIIPCLALLAISPWLFYESDFFRIVAIASWGAVIMLVFAFLLSGTGLGKWKPLRLILFFGMINCAALVAIFNILTGKRIEKWNPTGMEVPVDSSRLNWVKSK